mmetsp:Transcript_8848/g.20166  ORF Transcript_8848/g.20166 Transcript_8848/m.20166 type:complete len:238 (+) Transcript_8848:497-1210(+)
MIQARALVIGAVTLSTIFFHRAHENLHSEEAEDEQEDDHHKRYMQSSHKCAGGSVEQQAEPMKCYDHAKRPQQSEGSEERYVGKVDAKGAQEHEKVSYDNEQKVELIDWPNDISIETAESEHLRYCFDGEHNVECDLDDIEGKEPRSWHDLYIVGAVGRVVTVRVDNTFIMAHRHHEGVGHNAYEDDNIRVRESVGRNDLVALCVVLALDVKLLDHLTYVSSVLILRDPFPPRYHRR